MAGEHQVVLMSAGWSLTTGENGERTGTKVYFDAVTRPDKSSVNVPKVGDAWDAGDNKDVYIQSVTKSPIGEDSSAGFMYVCGFSTNYGSADILDIDRTDRQVSVSISTGGEFDTYTLESGKGIDVYKTTNLSDFTKIIDSFSISRMSPQTNITISERYVGSIADLIAENAALAGKLNSNAMWGLGEGMILCNGVTAVPVKVLHDGAKVIKWNRQYSYSVRHISNPGGKIVANAWQAVFYKGEYVILSKTDTTAGIDAMAPFLYAVLPDPIPSIVTP